MFITGISVLRVECIVLHDRSEYCCRRRLYDPLTEVKLTRPCQTHLHRVGRDMNRRDRIENGNVVPKSTCCYSSHQSVDETSVLVSIVRSMVLCFSSPPNSSVIKVFPGTPYKPVEDAYYPRS
jgi:hypothetical protein